MKKLLIVSLLVLLAGCSASAIDQKVLPDVQNKTLSLVIHETPYFLAITPDKDMLTSAGFNSATVVGNNFIQENGIYDPAVEISKKTAKSISSEYGLLYNENTVKKSKLKDTESLVRLANGRDFVLSVETDAWLFTYNIKFVNYHVTYISEARLIDANKAKSIWKSSCKYDTLSAGEPPVSYETLVENDAEYIKKALDKASNYCADKFSKELL